VSRLLSWLTVLVLVVNSVLLALFELFYLPLHLPRSLGGWAFPVTVLIAAGTLPLLVWATAKVGWRPGLAVAPVAAWLLTVLALGVAGPGGDKVLPADGRTLLLVAVGAVAGGVAAGRTIAHGEAAGRAIGHGEAAGRAIGHGEAAGRAIGHGEGSGRFEHSSSPGSPTTGPATGTAAGGAAATTAEVDNG
jgi:hypothetical protein